MKLNNKIRFGIIGCSDIARRKTIPALLNSEYASLHMIGSRSKEKAEKWAIDFNTKSSGTYYDILDNDEIDAVYISLPFALQEEWVIKAASSKKHVICEKSIVTSYNSAKSIVECGKKNQIRILEAFMFRFHPQHKRFSELLNHDLTYFNLFESKFGTLLNDRTGFRFDHKLGGSGLNDMGCYLVCASRMIFKEEPDRVVSNLIIDSQHKIDSEGSFILFFSSKKTALGSYSYNNFFQSKYSIWGQKSLIELTRAFAVKPNTNSHILISSDKGIQKIEIPWIDQSKLMIDEFSQVISLQKTESFNYEQDLISQARVLEALRISNSENRIVHLNELN